MRLSVSRVGCVVLGAALAGSLFLHARADAAKLAVVDGGAGETCTSELAACRRETLEVTFRTIMSPPAPSAPVVATARPEAPRDEGSASSDVDAQKRAFCTIGEEHVRAHWLARKDAIVASIRDIGTDDFSRRWTDDTMKKLGSKLGLRDEEKRRIERGYGALWAKHGAQMQARLAASPQDFAGLLEDARAFWRDEDALIGRELGDAAREDFRQSELKSRTAIAAIFGTFAGKKEYEDLAW